MYSTTENENIGEKNLTTLVQRPGDRLAAYTCYKCIRLCAPYRPYTTGPLSSTLTRSTSYTTACELHQSSPEMNEWSRFNALLDVANVAAQEGDKPNEYMTISKLEAAGVSFQLDPYNRNALAINQKYSSADAETSFVDLGIASLFNSVSKGQASTPDQTQADVIEKLEEQTRRSGMKPVTALGAVPAMPSPKTKCIRHYFPYCRLHPNRHLEPCFISPISPSNQEQKVYHGKLICDCTQSDSDSDMPLAEVVDNKKAKQGQPQYNGPAAYLLDPNRTDPVAMAIKSREDFRLSDLPSFLARGNPKGSSQSDGTGEVTFAIDPNLSKPEFIQPTLADRPTITRKTLKPRARLNEAGSETPVFSNRQKDVERSEERSEIKGFFSCKKELAKMRAERQKRDDDEMYAGLLAFQGSQRGWNGQHESVRRQTLKAYHEEENRQFQEALEKAKGTPMLKSTPKGKTASPRIGGRSSSFDTKGESKAEGRAVNAKIVEEGYSEYYAKAVQEDQNHDDYLEVLEAKTKKIMMSREWDLETIKREALEEQRARIATSENVDAKAKTNSCSGLTSAEGLTKGDDGLAANPLERTKHGDNGQDRPSEYEKVRV